MSHWRVHVEPGATYEADTRRRLAPPSVQDRGILPYRTYKSDSTPTKFLGRLYDVVDKNNPAANDLYKEVVMLPRDNPLRDEKLKLLQEIAELAEYKKACSVLHASVPRTSQTPARSNSIVSSVPKMSTAQRVAAANTKEAEREAARDEQLHRNKANYMMGLKRRLFERELPTPGAKLRHDNVGRPYIGV